MTLEDYRRMLGWSQAALARKAGINNQTAAKAEAGEPIASKTATAISEALSEALGRTILVSQIEGLNVRY